MIQVLIAGALGLAGTVAYLGYSGHLTGKHSTSSSIKPAPRAATSSARPATSAEAEDLRSGLSAQERQELREQLRGHWQSAHTGMRLVGTEAAAPSTGPGLVAGPESRRSP